MTNRTPLRLSIQLLALATLLLSSPLWADKRGEMEDYQRARQLVAEGLILPLETILKRAEISPGWKLLEVELEQEHDRWIYELEILKEDGEVIEVLYDAQSGNYLGID